MWFRETQGQAGPHTFGTRPEGRRLQAPTPLTPWAPGVPGGRSKLGGGTYRTRASGKSSQDARGKSHLRVASSTKYEANVQRLRVSFRVLLTERLRWRAPCLVLSFLPVSLSDRLLCTRCQGEA